MLACVHQAQDDPDRNDDHRARDHIFHDHVDGAEAEIPQALDQALDAVDDFEISRSRTKTASGGPPRKRVS